MCRCMRTFSCALTASPVFFDTFCDNFFVDWMVQSQILQAQDRVEEARQRVWEAVQQLQFLQGA